MALLAKILLLLALFAFRMAAQDLPVVVEEDSTKESVALPDSLRFYRPATAPRPKALNLTMTEYMVKSNMARLSYYAQGRYINSIGALEDVFIQANQFPEDVKNRMFGLAIAGGVAQELFRQTRKQLSKKNIRFIYPNLYGVNISYPLRPLKAQFYFRTMTLTDRYYMLYLRGGRYSLFYREQPPYIQRGIYVRLHKGLRLFYTRTQSQYHSYNGLGISNYSKKLFLYAMFSQNPAFPQYNQLYLFVNILFD
ncbi:hypothetical protein JXA02_10685 [candidate division KSB1 bacterium]|nr:hypothetical protein [candidate division KSB1 bacterium]RQW03072.1 MAG: hypothetical protein EH222_12780 [candidate division KSB1 bacterium]